MSGATTSASAMLAWRTQTALTRYGTISTTRHQNAYTPAQYGDRTSSMGNSLLGTCFNAPHAHALQWIQPLEVTQNMLPSNTWVPFVLNGSTRGGLSNGRPGRVSLMIRSWVDSTYWCALCVALVCMLRTGANFHYFNLLLKEGPNARLEQQYANRIVHHMYDNGRSCRARLLLACYLPDTHTCRWTGPARFPNHDDTSMVGVLVPGRRYIMRALQLVLVQGPVARGQTRLRICRYQGAKQWLWACGHITLPLCKQGSQQIASSSVIFAMKDFLVHRYYIC